MQLIEITSYLSFQGHEGIDTTSNPLQTFKPLSDIGAVHIIGTHPKRILQ